MCSQLQQRPLWLLFRLLELIKTIRERYLKLIEGLYRIFTLSRYI